MEGEGGSEGKREKILTIKNIKELFPKSSHDCDKISNLAMFTFS